MEKIKTLYDHSGGDAKEKQSSADRPKPRETARG